MSEAGRPPRRAVLRGIGAAAATVPLAACANSGNPDQKPTVASGTVIIAVDKVPVGGVASVTIDRRPAIVARPDAETVTAFSAVCTHQGCTVVPAGTILLCPCHQSHYELLTGAVLRGPAEQDLPPIEVHVDGDDVVTGAS